MIPKIIHYVWVGHNPKSKIIKELANGSIDTQTALKRTKVLLQELDNDDVLRWINCEIEGYSSGSDVPEYR